MSPVTFFPKLDRSWPSDGLGSVRVVLAQLPEPSTLPRGARILVFSTEQPRPSRILGWLLRRRHAHLSIRCTALLARGYRDVRVVRDPASGELLASGTAD